MSLIAPASMSRVHKGVLLSRVTFLKENVERGMSILWKSSGKFGKKFQIGSIILIIQTTKRNMT